MRFQKNEFKKREDIESPPARPATVVMPMPSPRLFQNRADHILSVTEKLEQLRGQKQNQFEAPGAMLSPGPSPKNNYQYGNLSSSIMQ